MELLERIRGCLLGGAAGDALGYPADSMTLAQIRDLFGPHGLTALPTSIHVTEKAVISAQMQMTLFTCEGLMMGYHKGVAGGMTGQTEEYVYEAYQDWLYTQCLTGRSMWHDGSVLLQAPVMHVRRDPDRTVLETLLSGEMGTLGDPLNRNRGAGCLARTAPVGFVKPFGSRYDDAPEDAYVWAGAKAAALTHGHPAAYLSAALVSEMIRCMVRSEGLSFRQVIECSAERLNRIMRPYDAPELDRVLEKIGQSFRLTETPSAPDMDIRQIGTGEAADEALAIALYCALRYTDDFAACICAAANHDGLSSVTACLAGELLGAYLGAGAVPERFAAPLDALETIETTASELAHVAADVYL